ncbi:uncharacterized protein B0I36DRAFT_365280 [Microdochium trichocladiopsis]|uniref:Uncharacterized protein n=1 Tax=Microdochium trichocladiopsis TaxID=1682393 RepID=A0A9P8Y5T9_9PEZI|nr:uncharacterized protein B0I36DRAFT_365280 [Microdochium trichocladiopsis]KAH7028175.1 hypothetical protein B0I36DRAFT_365280 [Microdochium trichocladiopsis]
MPSSLLGWLTTVPAASVPSTASPQAPTSVPPGNNEKSNEKGPNSPPIDSSDPYLEAGQASSPVSTATEDHLAGGNNPSTANLPPHTPSPNHSSTVVDTPIAISSPTPTYLASLSFLQALANIPANLYLSMMGHSPTLVDSPAASLSPGFSADSPSIITYTLTRMLFDDGSEDQLRFDFTYGIAARRFRVPSTRFTMSQCGRIFALAVIMAPLGAAFLHLAIAYLVYADSGCSPPNSDPRFVPKVIRLFGSAYPIAADAAVAIFVQSVTTWFGVLWVTQSSLKSPSIQPVGFITEPRNSWVRWFVFLDQDTAQPELVSWCRYMAFIFGHLMRATLLTFLRSSCVSL